MIKLLPDTAAGRDKLGWQTEYRKSKCISNETIKPQKMVTRFLALQEKKVVYELYHQKIFNNKKPSIKTNNKYYLVQKEAALTIKRFY